MMLRVFPYGALQFVSYEQYKKVRVKTILIVMFIIFVINLIRDRVLLFQQINLDLGKY